jgi:glycosyltransferase involved in cell wall biosynthesis
MMYPPRTLPVPTVVTVHDVIPYRLQSYHGRFRERLYFDHIRKHLPQATRIVAISEATAVDIATLFPALSERVTVILNGVHPDFFRPVAVEEMETLGAHYHLVRHPRLLYVGGYDARKNVPTILRACQKIFTRLSDGELVLVGALHYPEVMRLVSELGLEDRVVLTPHLSRREVVALYHASDLFVFPSTYEGFGLPPAQALAVGLPVVAGDTPAVSEVLGDCGMVVPPMDIDAWVQTVTKVLETPALAQKMAARGRARAEDFNWEAIARQYQNLYESIAR